MDPASPIVKLCVEGMAAEAKGRTDDALRLFERAWHSARDDVDACIAAHYVARHQPTLECALEWNVRALRRADAVGDERVRPFYPSLHLNVAWALERLGNSAAACEHYSMAAERLADLPDDGYGRMVRSAVT